MAEYTIKKSCIEGLSILKLTNPIYNGRLFWVSDNEIDNIKKVVENLE